ncbi:intracellular ribonuclease LX-like [Prosopis cineraria]|uniref:intracellular ribonuclease LX-like n=1 Tax=Prosopis cineraria TaxID=364024 RepID=UPI00240EE13C|nr:intracellular ribonuclease LX-like [Prosopis cineraria]
MPNDSSLKDDHIFQELKGDLLEYWPNLEDPENFSGSKRFWRYEWIKHGTCSNFAAKEYLEKTIDHTKRYAQAIFNNMIDNGIHPDGTTEYNSSHVLNAIKNVTKKNAFLACKDDVDGKFQLYEIRLCFANNDLEDCRTTGNCNKKFIFASPPESNHDLFLVSESSSKSEL